MVELPPGSRVEVRRGSLPVLLARLPAAAAGAVHAGTGPARADEKRTGQTVRIGAPFTDRLVEKFGLPVAGWRGQSGDRVAEDAPASDEMGQDTLAHEEFSDRGNEEPGGHA